MVGKDLQWKNRPLRQSGKVLKGNGGERADILNKAGKGFALIIQLSRKKILTGSKTRQDLSLSGWVNRE
jgi:hypothetical protein